MSLEKPLKRNYRRVLRNILLSQLKRSGKGSLEMNTSDYSFIASLNGEEYDLKIQGAKVEVYYEGNKVSDYLANFILNRLQATTQGSLAGKECRFNLSETPPGELSNIEYLKGNLSQNSRSQISLDFRAGRLAYRVIVSKDSVEYYFSYPFRGCNSKERVVAARALNRLGDLDLSLSPTEIRGHFEYVRHYILNSIMNAVRLATDTTITGEYDSLGDDVLNDLIAKASDLGAEKSKPETEKRTPGGIDISDLLHEIDEK